jgi:hypothetical protein
MSYVYLIRNGESFLFKVGIAQDVESRLAQLQTGNPVELVVESSYEFPNAEIIEKVLHQKWSSVRTRGEWFDFNTRDVEQFDEICRLLGGVPYSPNADVSSPEDVEEAESLAEPAEGVTKWDYAAMFADGWCMDIYGNGRTNGQGKYWGWRKRKDGQSGYVYGGLIDELPYPIPDMRLIYRDGQEPFNPPRKRSDE